MPPLKADTRINKSVKTLKGSFYAKKSKLTDEERIAAEKEYLYGKGNIAEIAGKHRISSTTFIQPVKRAQREGLDSIRLSSHNKLIGPLAAAAEGGRSMSRPPPAPCKISSICPLPLHLHRKYAILRKRGVPYVPSDQDLL